MCSRTSCVVRPKLNARSYPLPGVSVDEVIFPFAHGNDDNQDKVVTNLVNKTIPGVAEFDLVAVR